MAGKVKPGRPLPPLQVEPEQWPAWAVERRRLSDLKPHPRNVRTHSQKQIEEICASIAEHGFAKLSIVADESDVILAGHGNVQALKRFGEQIADVPVTVVRGWTEEQKMLFMLRDNRVAANAGWDRDALGLQLLELSALPHVDLTLLGFKAVELEKLMPKDPPADGEAPDADPQAPARSRAGDVWTLGDHRLHVGAGDLYAADAAVKRWETFTKKRATRAAGAHQRKGSGGGERQGKTARPQRAKVNHGPQPKAGRNSAAARKSAQAE
jgi:ParB-like chromosome segregation protein Spo0J